MGRARRGLNAGLWDGKVQAFMSTTIKAAIARTPMITANTIEARRSAACSDFDLVAAPSPIQK
jgi:hypothetical protein